MRNLVGLAIVIAIATPAIAKQAQDKETAFVWCLSEKQPELIDQIKDADSEAAFVEGMKAGSALCETDVDGMSMGKLFKLFAKHSPSKAELAQ